jgi:ring-1,2-phenylacetyl-CoA epoxidase subunit PaaA
VPAHLDQATGQFVIDVPFPMHFDEDAKRWDLERGAISWDEVLGRWRRRGPCNEEFVAMIQRGYRQLQPHPA